MKKRTNRFLAMILSIVMLVGMLPASALAVENREVTSDQQVYQQGDVNCDGEITNADVIIIARYLVNLFANNYEAISRIEQYGDANGDGKVSNTDLILIVRIIVESNFMITREKWIIMLMDELEIQYSDHTDYLFDDFENVAEPWKIDAAIRMGIVSVEPDQDNIFKFYPKEYATREFVASTLIAALGYYITEEELLPKCNDINMLAYPLQDCLAVKLGVFNLINDEFKPNKSVSDREAEQAISIAVKILNSTKIDPNAEPIIEYANGVEQSTLKFTLDEKSYSLIIDESEEVANWQVGDIRILWSEDGSQKDIAIKIVEIRKENGKILISYEEPELNEIINYFNFEGVESSEGTFTPAEGVSVVEPQQRKMTRDAASDTVDLQRLFGKKTLSINAGGFSGQVTLNLKNLEYRFVTSPSWHLFTIDEVYFALNSEIGYKLSYTYDALSGLEKIKLGDFNAPVGYGVNVSGEIYLLAEATGTFSVGYKITNTSGVQYTNGNGIRPICRTSTTNTEFSIEGGLKCGASIEPGAEFLGVDLVSVGVEVGKAFEGSLSNVNLNNREFCLDGTYYTFLSLYGKIGWDELNLKKSFDILNSNNSFDRRNLHFEETGHVRECTRGYGNYRGFVVRADDISIPIRQAKVEVFSNNTRKDITYTNANGAFAGIELPSGSYTLRVSASGYLPYEQTFEIVGGATTTLRNQLMCERGEELDDGTKYAVSGFTTDAYTGRELADAKIEVYSQRYDPNIIGGSSNLVLTCFTTENGHYRIELPIGNYKLVVSKEGYVTNTEYITVVSPQHNVNVFLNPGNLPSVEGNLRIVLKWGATPSDLDSHIVSYQNYGTDHVYYSNMSEANMNLDVDDITSYGPETITINNATTGQYSYYVHNYSDRNSSNNSNLASSTAQVEVYDGTALLYTISVPTDRDGTLWHVFDYDTDTNQITLINEFSYQSTPSSVGSRSASTYRMNKGLDVHIDDKLVKIQ